MVTLVAACGGAPPASPAATAAPAVASPTAARTASPSSAPEPSTGRSASAGASAAGAASWVSDGLVVPLSLTPPSWANAVPDTAESNFVTWDSDVGLALRVLAPASLYRPGEATTSDVPADYVAYLDTLADHGVTLADRTTTTIAGHPATVVTITTDASVDGALGCASAGQSAEDCFGPQPDLALRFAVIDVDGTPLLVWLRTPAGSDSRAAIAEFDQLLQSIDLR